jgi:hypothetical protein
MTKATVCILTIALGGVLFSSCNSSQKKQKSEEQNIVESVSVDGKLVDDFKKSNLNRTFLSHQQSFSIPCA